MNPVKLIAERGLGMAERTAGRDGEMSKVPSYVPRTRPVKGKSVLITAAAGGGHRLRRARRVLEECARALVISDIHPRALTSGCGAEERSLPERRFRQARQRHR